jgi:hypothetical protein
MAYFYYGFVFVRPSGFNVADNPDIGLSRILIISCLTLSAEANIAPQVFLTV